MSKTLVLPLTDYPSFYLVGRALLKECLLEWYEEGEELSPRDKKLVDGFPQSSMPRGGEVFIAVKDGDPAGFIAVAKSVRGVYEIKHLYVDPDYYYEGVERELVETAKRWVDSSKRSLEVYVEKKSQEVIRFYSKLRFEVFDAEENEDLSRLTYRRRIY